jgi:hypothetical protein
VKVPQREYDREKDLVIKVFSEGQIQGDPDVYISRVSEGALNNSVYRITRSLTGRRTVSGCAPHTEKILVQSAGRSSGQMSTSTLVYAVGLLKMDNARSLFNLR